MNKAIRSILLSSSLALVTAPLVGAENSGTGPAPATDPPITTGGGDQWLDAVRAQRQAWEERRRAAREATDTRRRLHSSRAEAIQQEQQRRHEAFLGQIERDREYFLGQGPWQTPAPPTAGVNPEATPTSPNPSPLPGWDNRWYFRGY